MLAVAFTFPAGRYHATPWDRHVNEGAVAWPPEPWRVLRALIATWHHKLKYHGAHKPETLHALMESLAAELPHYTLPPATHSHTRHYMPQFGDKTSLVFDAFTAINPNDPLVMVWQTLELPTDQRALLDDLLAVMGYLGRAESWVEAQCLSAAPAANCIPSREDVDPETGEVQGELVTLYAPQSAADYQTVRAAFFVGKKPPKKLIATLPATLLDALSLDTADLRKQGWSQPPAARKVSYLRPLDALKPQRKPVARAQPSVKTMLFVVDGKPLPRVENSLKMGELMRFAVMSQCKRAFGEQSIPSIFSGHDLAQTGVHRHAFYLPWDSNADGRIDRVLIHAPDGISALQQRALAKLNKLWSRDGEQWRLMYEGSDSAGAAHPLLKASCVWQSVTPYLHPWHRKKRLMPADQIRRECEQLGLPEVLHIEPFEKVGVGRDRQSRAIDFHRFRSRRAVQQPDRHGGFYRLTFAAPVNGPLALGFACHYGLGLFQPAFQPAFQPLSQPVGATAFDADAAMN